MQEREGQLRRPFEHCHVESAGIAESENVDHAVGNGNEESGETEAL